MFGVLTELRRYAAGVRADGRRSMRSTSTVGERLGDACSRLKGTLSGECGCALGENLYLLTILVLTPMSWTFQGH